MKLTDTVITVTVVTDIVGQSVFKLINSMTSSKLYQLKKNRMDQKHFKELKVLAIIYIKFFPTT